MFVRWSTKWVNNKYTFTGALACGILHHLAALESIHFVQIIDMGQDEVKIPGLAALSQIVRTCAAGDHVHRRAAPLFDDCRCPGILRLVARRTEDFCNPRAA